jgi:release factor glutamine methyltransferase
MQSCTALSAKLAVTSTEATHLLRFVKRHFMSKLHSTGACRRAIKSGKISVDGAAVTDQSVVVRTGQIVELGADAGDAERERLARSVKLRVICETNDVAVVWKPAGVPSDSLGPAATNRPRANAAAALPHVLKGVGDASDALVVPQLLYSLSRPVSGLLLVAKTKKALHFLRQQLLTGGLKLRFRVVAAGRAPSDGRVNSAVKLENDAGAVLVFDCIETASNAAGHLTTLEASPCPGTVITAVASAARCGAKGLVRMTPVDKAICKTLSMAGLPVVGTHEGRAAFTNGVFMSLVALTVDGGSGAAAGAAGSAGKHLPAAKRRRVDLPPDRSLIWPFGEVRCPEPKKFEATRRRERLALEKRRVGAAETVRERRLRGGKGDPLLPPEYEHGFALFCGLRLTVSPAVLIPRSSSESLVRCAEEKLACLRKQGRVSASVLDLGTGSGCLLLATLKAASQAESPVGSTEASMTEVRPASTFCASGVGLDISRDAIEVAHRNALVLGLGRRARFAVGDFASLHEKATRAAISAVTTEVREDQIAAAPFDIMLCNPPYLSEGSFLNAASRAHEPGIAIFAGAQKSEQLSCYRAIASSLRLALARQPEPAGSPRLLRDGAHVILEVPAGRSSAVREIFSGVAALEFVKQTLDASNTERCLVFRFSLAEPAGVGQRKA